MKSFTTNLLIAILVAAAASFAVDAAPIKGQKEHNDSRRLRRLLTPGKVSIRDADVTDTALAIDPSRRGLKREVLLLLRLRRQADLLMHASAMMKTMEKERLVSKLHWNH